MICASPQQLIQQVYSGSLQDLEQEEGEETAANAEEVEELVVNEQIMGNRLENV